MYPFEKAQLFRPTLDEVAKVLQDGLHKTFSSVDVSVVDCPNLSKKPFMLAAEGICGNPSLADVGGVPYLVPVAQKDKIYNLKEIAKMMNMSEALIIGAGAGPRHHIGMNCEMMANIKLGKKEFNNTHVAKLGEADKCQLIHLKESTEFCLLGNLFLSEGKPGKVIKVSAKHRKADGNFVSMMRKALADYFKENPVGMGGVFVIKSGKAKLHIMMKLLENIKSDIYAGCACYAPFYFKKENELWPVELSSWLNIGELHQSSWVQLPAWMLFTHPDYSTTPLKSDDDVNNWLKFFNMTAPLSCLSCFISCDPGLDLRIEHTHCFSDHGEGGHYHEDTEPEVVEYEGYFNVAEQIFRFDPPNVTHNIGRD